MQGDYFHPGTTAENLCSVFTHGHPLGVPTLQVDYVRSLFVSGEPQ
jgi:hypothetical protein